MILYEFILRQILLHTTPYYSTPDIPIMSHPSRYQEVMAIAFRLKSDPIARSAHLRKSRACTKSHSHPHEECGWAHSVTDFSPPVCFYQEFCRNNGCAMFHPGVNGVISPHAVNEYIKKNNITFLSASSLSSTSPSSPSSSPSPSSPSPNRPHRNVRTLPNGAFTRFCNNVSDGNPCTRSHGTCTFSHGLDQLALPEDDEKFPIHSCECCAEYRNNSTRRYNLHHYCRTRLALAQELGYDVKPWMLRNHLLNIADYVKMTNDQKALIDEIRAEEELINDQNVEEVCDVLEKMGLAESICTDFAENSMNFAMEQERLDGDGDYDDDDFRVIINPIHPEKLSISLSDL